MLISFRAESRVDNLELELANITKQMKKQTQAEEMAAENYLDVEINQAYIDNVGEKYAKAEDVEESYQGQYSSDEEFAQIIAKNSGAINENLQWPYTCIDWEFAAKELMYDYFEVDGYYFRSL